MAKQQDISNNNALSYPTMVRQREENIQSQQIAYAEDVNAELDHIHDVYNRLVKMLSGEWGDDTGRIYDLVDEAITIANQALSTSNEAVKRSGDTMTGQLNTALEPVSDYNMVNKKYVDDTVNKAVTDSINRLEKVEQFIQDLKAENVKLENTNFAAKNVNDALTELFISVSNGKKEVAAAITDKGVTTAGDASFHQMANNIHAILTFKDGTAGGTATDADIMKGKTAYARGTLLIGTHVCKGGTDTSDATATPYDILENKTAYGANGKIVGVLTINSSSSGGSGGGGGGDSSGGSSGSTPSYNLSGVEKVYGTVSGTIQRRRMKYENKEQGCVDIARSNRTTGDAPNDFLVYTIQSKVIANNDGANAGKTLGIYADKLAIQTLVAYDSEKGYKLDVPEHTETYTMEELGLTSDINPVEDNGVIVLTLGVSERTSLGSYNLALAVRNKQGTSSDDGLYNIEIFLYEVVYKIDKSNPDDIKAYWAIEDKQPLRITFKTVNSYFCKKNSRIIFKEGKDVFALISGYGTDYPRS